MKYKGYSDFSDFQLSKMGLYYEMPYLKIPLYQSNFYVIIYPWK